MNVSLVDEAVRCGDRDRVGFGNFLKPNTNVDKAWDSIKKLLFVCLFIYHLHLTDKAISVKNPPATTIGRLSSCYFQE